MQQSVQMRRPRSASASSYYLTLGMTHATCLYSIRDNFPCDVQKAPVLLLHFVSN